ncbi:MAG: type II secretion system protein [Firmicutes bacterium]|nr:type II secretion system protein [Bacillota bacterium]
MKNKKGFTLIELLAVIVILGLLMAIAIPSVTKYITESRKKTVTSTIGNYIGALVNDVNDLSYTFTEANTVYAVPIECIALERGGTNPFGAWHQANNAYWAYVLVQYNDQTSSYTYGYTFKDSAGYGLYPTSQSKLNEQGKQIQTGLSLSRPKNGKVTTITELKNWNGFIVNDTTNLVVLEAESEGNTGDGKTTCTLQQKGDNYASVEEEKKPKILTFKVNRVNYQFEEGMTWGEWVNSKYNTSDFFVLNNNEIVKGEPGDIDRVFYSCPVLKENQLNNTEYFEYPALPGHQLFENVSYFTAFNPNEEWCDDICSKEPYYIFVDSNGNLTYVEN